MDKNDVVIVDALRTPFDKFGGVMRDLHAMELGKFVIQEIVKRNNLGDNTIDEVYYGTCMQIQPAYR